jgi:extracellular factor (EF) 3-hydroxypalmitic acid methyl ester biosynthesis protein
MSLSFEEESPLASFSEPSVVESTTQRPPTRTRVRPLKQKRASVSLARLHAQVREQRPPIHREVWSGLLDQAYLTLRSDRWSDSLERFFVGLNEMKASANPDWWLQFSEIDSLTHPIKDLLHEDPFTLRSFEKPRGYAGDAVMLDYIYREREAPATTSDIGRRIFQFTTNAPASQSVRARRDILAHYVDQAAARHPDPRVLAIACGHLREAARSNAMRSGRIHNFFAFDQDADSLALVEESYPARGIKTIQGSVKGILSGKVEFNDMDLVYAAGLYDYLSERVAERLTQQIFDMLAPGGRLLVANFAPNLRDIGYMETYMGWKLIYRTSEDMAKLSVDIPADAIASQRVFSDEQDNIVFLEVTKKK